MYAGPIVKTYYSLNAYRRDAALMTSYGYMSVNIEQFNMTDGLALTLILIFGLLLTPMCIGVVILCFLPMAFSKRWNVTYIPHSQIPGRALPYAPQLLPHPPQVHQPQFPQPRTLPLNSRPLAQLSAPQTSGQYTYPRATANPAYPRFLMTSPQQSVPLAGQVRERFVNAWQTWNSWKLWQQVLSVVGAAVVVGIAMVGILVIAVYALPH